MWESPIVDLVTQMNIDTLLLPLSWWDLFPHQLAHSNEDAWARGLQINILSANTHSSAGWSSGSGIYSTNGHLAYVHDLSPQSGGTLLVADLDIKPAKVFLKLPNDFSIRSISRETLPGPNTPMRMLITSQPLLTCSKRLCMMICTILFL